MAEEGAEKVDSAWKIPAVAKATLIAPIAARLKPRPFKTATFQRPLKSGLRFPGKSAIGMG
jgi:hypothetical protein